MSESVVIFRCLYDSTLSHTFKNWIAGLDRMCVSATRVVQSAHVGANVIVNAD